MKQSRILNSNALQCLVEVEDDVIGIFESHAEADEATAELLGIKVDALIIARLGKDETLVMTKRNGKGYDFESSTETLHTLVVGINSE